MKLFALIDSATNKPLVSVARPIAFADDEDASAFSPHNMFIIYPTDIGFWDDHGTPLFAPKMYVKLVEAE